MNELFFKITNKEECHNDFQYKDGLNILQDEFANKESGNCVKGGLYFSDVEHILNFLDFGIYLREIMLPINDEEFQMVSVKDDKWRASRIILGKRHDLSDPNTFRYLANLGADVAKHKDVIFGFAIKNGYPDIAEYAVELGINIDISVLIKIAVDNGHFDMMKYWIGKSHWTDKMYWKNIDWTEAAHNKHFDIAKYLIENGANVGEKDKKYPIFFDYQLETIKFLVKYGANLAANNNHVVKLAVENNCLESVSYLIEQGIDKNIAFIAAVKTDRTEIINYLLQQGIDKNKVLVDAAAQNCLDTVQFLTTKIDIKTVDNIGDVFKSAVENCCFELVRLFVELGIDVHTDKDCALKKATDNKNWDMVQFLIKHGADIHIRRDYPLRKAIECCHHDTVCFLVEHGANINILSQCEIYMTENKIETIKFLINEGLDINKYRGKILNWAITNNQLDTIKMLIEKNISIRLNLFDLFVSISSKNIADDLAVIFSVERGYFEMVQLLINNGSAIREFNDGAVKAAARHGHLEIVKYLVEKGAGIGTDKNNAIAIALKNCHIDIARYLTVKFNNL